MTSQHLCVLSSTPKVGPMCAMVGCPQRSLIDAHPASHEFSIVSFTRMPHAIENSAASVCLQKRCQITCSLARISRWSLADLNDQSSTLKVTTMVTMAGKLKSMDF